MLVEGRWVGDWTPADGSEQNGSFARRASTFRHWVTPDGRPGPTGDDGFQAEANRYHLYVALICPWACRTLMARAIKRLERLISISVVEPVLTDQGWRFGDFPGADRDTLNGAAYLHEIYTKADPRFCGRATVPVLWDKHRRTIVNNESSDILRMLNTAFKDLAGEAPDLYPADLAPAIDAYNDGIYQTLNNGVYRAGFAKTQAAYAEAAKWPTTFYGQLRFDTAYHGLFKCNTRTLASYPKLSRYMQRMLAVDGVRDTVDLTHIKQGYYSIKALNPTGIVPLGPDLSCLGL